MASLIRSELARVLIEEVSDPSLREVVITEVELSRDLKNARVFYAKGAANVKEVGRGLHRALPYFKRKLGDNLQLRHIPDLQFEVDTHGESLTRLMNLFHEIEGNPKSGDLD